MAGGADGPSALTRRCSAGEAPGTVEPPYSEQKISEGKGQHE